MSSQRNATLVLMVVYLATAADAGAGAGPEPQAHTDCVDIGKPQPTMGYTYRYRDSRGGAAEYTSRWDEVSATGSRVRTARRGAGGSSASVQVNRHRIVDNIVMIEQSTQSGTDTNGPLRNATTFRPAIFGDPAFRACAGRSWRIASVTATHVSLRGSHSAKSDVGELRIVALRVPVTVPAGRFDTVHYTRTMTSPVGRVTDEYWKSIEHGVIVKHRSTLPGATVSEELVSIAR